jgi:DNA replication regulator SLD3
MVYAVEHESSGLYVLCKLGPWVDIESLSQSATVVCRERMRSGKLAKPENAPALPFTTPLLYKESKRRRLAIEEIQLLVRKRSGSVAEECQAQVSTAAEERPASRGLDGQSTGPSKEHAEAPVQTHSAVSSEQVAPTPDPAPAGESLAQPSAEDIFQNIRGHYLEALYHSKVLPPLLCCVPSRADQDRDHWHTSQKALSPGPGQPSIWRATRMLRSMAWSTS